MKTKPRGHLRRGLGPPAGGGNGPLPGGSPRRAGRAGTARWRRQGAPRPRRCRLAARPRGRAQLGVARSRGGARGGAGTRPPCGTCRPVRTMSLGLARAPRPYALGGNASGKWRARPSGAWGPWRANSHPQPAHPAFRLLGATAKRF